MTHSRLLTLLILGLTLFGLIMVADASVVTAARDFGDQWYYFKLQSLWAGLGLLAFFFSSKLPLKIWSRLAVPLFFINLFFLVLVLIPGIGVKLLGARRWINFGLLSFQPAELAKLSTCLYLSALFRHPPRLLQLFMLVGSQCLLILLEPDLGTALVVFGLGLAIYFVAGGKLVTLALSVPVLILAVFGLIFISPYRTARLKSFFNHSADSLGSSYHVRQSLLGLGSGGIWGIGLGQSRQKYQFLPETTTDSIFAIVGEEFGLMGTGMLLFGFVLFISTGFRIARAVSPPYSLLAVGITAWIGLQTFINISALTALLPFTGIPLPFISYGGSSLLITLVASGILVAIARSVHEN